MDPTKRQITKIAREAARFTVLSLKEEGIGSSELDFIHAVRKNPGITQQKLSEKLGLDKAAIARQAASLEKKGFLIRKSNPLDRRSRILFATEKADRLKHTKAGIETCFYEWLLDGFSDQEKKTFAALLERLYERCRTESRAGFPVLSDIMEAK